MYQGKSGKVREYQGTLSYLAPSSSTVKSELRDQGTKSHGMYQGKSGKVREHQGTLSYLALPQLLF